MTPSFSAMSASVEQSPNSAVGIPQFGADWLNSRIFEPMQGLMTLAATTTGQSADRTGQNEAGPPPTASELRLLSAALMAMQEIERKRIANDLHDSIGQSLSALSFGIDLAIDGTRRGNVQPTCELLEKLAAQVKETIVEVQRIAMALRPATLDDIGLVATLTWFFREFRSIHPNLTLRADIELEECDVLPDLRTNIFRVVQEAFSNILKHARASEIHVRLLRREHEVHLEVADNGVGFSIKDVTRTVVTGSGMGLKGMRDRAEFFGGQLCVASVPGMGTQIFVSWPASTG